MLKIKLISITVAVALATVGSLSACAPKADPDKVEVASTYMLFANDLLALAPDEAAYTLNRLEDADAAGLDEDRKKYLIQSSKMTAWEAFAILQPKTETFDDEKDLLIDVLRTRSYISSYNVKVIVPADAVTIKGNKATIDRENFYIIYDDFGGSRHPQYSKSALAEMPDITLVKIAGRWMIPSTSNVLTEIYY